MQCVGSVSDYYAFLSGVQFFRHEFRQLLPVFVIEILAHLVHGVRHFQVDYFHELGDVVKEFFRVFNSVDPSSPVIHSRDYRSPS